MTRTSPNWDSRDSHVIDMLVLHYTGMRTASEALERLCDPSAKVSAHYMVEEDGTVHALVPEEMRAWHAGVSSWRGHTNINQRSIGIEIANPGHEFGYRPFPHAQMDAVATLCKGILSRHPIPPRNVVAHSDVAPQRKEDPGELFEWQWLAQRSIGLWPAKKRHISSETFGFWGNSVRILLWVFSNILIPNLFHRSLPSDHPAVRPIDDYAKVQAQLTQYGYDCPQTGEWDEATSKIIIAFQRHFFPQRLTGRWDRECALRLASLLSLI